MTPLFFASNNTGGTRINRLNLLVFALLLSMVSSAACSLPPAIHHQDVDGLGQFEFRAAEPPMKGVVVGAPHGVSSSVLAIVADAVSDQTGAGIGHGPWLSNQSDPWPSLSCGLLPIKYLLERSRQTAQRVSRIETDSARRRY
jgi:hypothetical protein